MSDHYVSDRRELPRPSQMYVLLGLILVLGAILRFWGINRNFHFEGDEGTQTAIEWHLLQGHLPLLGPSLSIGSGSMHLGPAFYYLMALPLYVSDLSPVGPTVMVGIFGLAAVVLLFLYLRPAVGDYPALGASAVMAASFLMVEYSRRPWNPTPTPFFTLLLLWGLLLWKRRSSAWLVMVAGSLAVLLQLQPVNVFLVVPVVAFIILARPPRPGVVVLVGSVATFLIISSPLIIYDSLHHFANTRAWLDVLVHGKSKGAPRSASSIRLLFNLFNRAFELPIVALSIILSVVLVLAALYVGLSRRRDEERRWEILLSLILLLTAAVGFEIYRKAVFEQYMVCLFIIPFVCIGALLSLLSGTRYLRIIALLIVAGLVVVGVRDTWTYTVLSPHITVPDASVTRSDLQRDDTYGHVVRVDRAMEKWAGDRTIRLSFASYQNTYDAYLYVLRTDGYSCRKLSATAASCTFRGARGRMRFLLVEPSDWRQSQWFGFAKHEESHAVRLAQIGIVRLFEWR